MARKAGVYLKGFERVVVKMRFFGRQSRFGFVDCCLIGRRYLGDAPDDREPTDIYVELRPVIVRIVGDIISTE